MTHVVRRNPKVTLGPWIILTNFNLLNQEPHHSALGRSRSTINLTFQCMESLRSTSSD